MSARFEVGHYLFPLDALPAGWTVCSLGEIAEIQLGQASGRYNRQGQGVPHLRPMNISAEGELDLTDIKYIAADDAGLELVTGDVLFNNTNSPLLVGKTAHVKYGGRLAFSNHMTRIRPFQGIDALFLARQLHALHRVGYFQKHCKQYVNQASITSAFLRHQVPVLLPPEREQRRISVHLEELLARRRRASTALDEVPELTRMLRQTLLTAAYTGRLTAGWRARNMEVAPSSGLLNQIRNERRRRWLESQHKKRSGQQRLGPTGTDYPEAVAPDAGGMLPLPATWRLISFDELAWSLRSGTSSQAHLTETPHRVLRSSAVRPGAINYTEVAFLDEPGSPDDYLAEGDLLFTRLSGSLEYVGNCAIVRGLQEPLLFPDRFFRARIVSTVDPTYVEGAFECAILGAGGRARSSSTGQHRISLAALRAFPIPLPPLAEQREIVRLLEATRAHAARLLNDTDEARQQLAAVERSALVRTFSGQLVPQELSDEPAVELLARVRRQLPVDQSVTAPTSPRSLSGAGRVVTEDGSTRLVATLRRLGGRAIVTDLAREAGYLPSEDEVDENDRVGAFYLALASARQRELLTDRRLPSGEVWLELTGP